MLCGLLATLSLSNMELESVRLTLAYIVSLGCLSLGVYIAYAAYQEHKTQKLTEE
jgi:hypothetical protein